MNPFLRICLLALVLALAAGGARADVGGADVLVPRPFPLANPARGHGSLPLTVEKRARRPALPLGVRAVRIAKLNLGVPYRWGGVSPSGFDCSGLVTYVFGRLGISLPHNAAAQYASGRPVRWANLRPGDLVFFHGLGHVGLYVGNGEFIHAPQSGERVEIQSLASRRGTIVGARRMLRS